MEPSKQLTPELETQFKQAEQKGGLLMLKQVLESLQKYPLRKTPALQQKS